MTSESGTITTPGYPGNYTNDLDCQYTITYDEDKIGIKTSRQNSAGVQEIYTRLKRIDNFVFFLL